jgi:hypothetical protein
MQEPHVRTQGGEHLVIVLLLGKRRCVVQRTRVIGFRAHDERCDEFFVVDRQRADERTRKFRCRA